MSLQLESRNGLKIYNDLHVFHKANEDCRVIYQNKTKSKSKDFLFWSGNSHLIVSKDVFFNPNIAPPLYLSKYFNSSLVGNSLLITQVSAVAKDCVINNRFFNESAIDYKDKDSVKLKANVTSSSSKQKRVLALTSSGLQKAYTHWFTEIFPKIIPYFEIKNEDESLKIVVEESISNYQLEMLNLVGVADNDIIKKPVHQKLNADLIYLISPPGLIYLHDKVFWLYDKMLTNLDVSKVRDEYKDIGSKIFISRKGLAYKRSLLNISSLQQKANEFGFNAIIPEEMNIHEKMFVFSNASHVIGEAGGGLSNIVFSKPQTRVMTMSSDAFPSPIFSNIAASRLLKIGYIFGTSIQYKFNKHNNNSHFVVDESIFLKNLKVLLES